MTFTYHLCTTILPAHAGTEANSSWLHNKHEKTWVTGHDGDQAASVPLGYDGIRMPDWFPSARRMKYSAKSHEPYAIGYQLDIMSLAPFSHASHQCLDFCANLATSS